jgi:hypothetical protein
MKPLSTVYAPSRVKWRQWLSTHYQSANEIWLIYYKKASGKPRIAYNDAVEEALCFGWIDSTVRRLDDERYMQRFSPRNPKSPYSPANRERLRRLVKARKVRKDRGRYSGCHQVQQTCVEALSRFFRELQAHTHWLHRRGAAAASRISEALEVFPQDDGAEPANRIRGHREILLIAQTV